MEGLKSRLTRIFLSLQLILTLQLIYVPVSGLCPKKSLSGLCPKKSLWTKDKVGESPQLGALRASFRFAYDRTN